MRLRSVLAALPVRALFQASVQARANSTAIPAAASEGTIAEDRAVAGEDDPLRNAGRRFS